MSRAQTLYIEGDSIFHKLSGVSKILLFVIWTMITVMFLDLRVFLVMGLISAIMLYFAKIPSKTIKPLLWIMVVFNIINVIFILLITPQYGSELVGSNTELRNFILCSYNIIKICSSYACNCHIYIHNTSK